MPGVDILGASLPTVARRIPPLTPPHPRHRLNGAIPSAGPWSLLRYTRALVRPYHDGRTTRAGIIVESARVTGRVRIVRFNWQDRAIALGPGAHVVGRDPDSAVWVDSPVVSRQHARIAVSVADATIEDLGSHNGTYVNDERCDGVRRLAHGDRIRIGPASFVVFDPPELDPTATDPNR